MGFARVIVTLAIALAVTCQYLGSYLADLRPKSGNGARRG
jgi:hypothetical protein